MLHRLLAIGIVVAGTALTGCTVKNVEEDFSLDPSAQDGIVVVSVSHDLEGGRGTTATFRLDDDGALESLKDVVPTIKGGSEFEEVYGELYVVRLPAGDHAITSWVVSSGTGIFIRPRETPEPLRFTVAAGRIKYLGNLHGLIHNGKNLFGMRILGQAYAIVQDQRERDLAALDANYPNLAGKATVDLLPLGLWPDTGEISRRVDLPPPVYIPPGIK